MCLRVNCKHCQKPTFTGCGKHAEQVLRGVEVADRCQCLNVRLNASQLQNVSPARSATG